MVIYCVYFFINNCINNYFRKLCYGIYCW